MVDLKDSLIELKEVISNVVSKNIDFNIRTIENEFDFKKREREYYSKEIESAIKKVEAVLSESFVVMPAKRTELAEVSSKIKEIKKIINAKNFDEAVLQIDELYDTAPSIKISENNLPRQEFSLPYIPKDIFAETKASFDELLKCYQHNCYRSALILCGRILEISLHYVYFKSTGQDLLEKSPDIGLGNLVLKFKEKNISIDPGLSNQIHLINQLRISAVHKKKQIFNPSKAQAQASIIYMLDILKKLFATQYKTT